jgi:hypothetical protein
LELADYNGEHDMAINFSPILLLFVNSSINSPVVPIHGSSCGKVAIPPSIESSRIYAKKWSTTIQETINARFEATKKSTEIYIISILCNIYLYNTSWHFFALPLPWSCTNMQNFPPML